MTKMFLEIPMEGNMENQVQEDQFIKEMDYHDTYGGSCGFVTRWSIYSEDQAPIFGVKYNGKMGEKSPFVPGTVITNKCSVWGYNTSAVVGGKGLWCDVWLACDSAIRNAVDTDGNPDHHIFIEGFERNEDGTYAVVTGS